MPSNGSDEELTESPFLRYYPIFRGKRWGKHLVTAQHSPCHSLLRIRVERQDTEQQLSSISKILKNLGNFNIQNSSLSYL